MLILETEEYIAGIFTEGMAAGDYLTAMPVGMQCMIENADLHYPFWIVETEAHNFMLFQLQDEARRTTEYHANSILYTIEGDYSPHPPWADEMGSLPHEHF